MASSDFRSETAGSVSDFRSETAGSVSDSEVVNPATGEVLSYVPATTAAETDAAIEASRRAFDSWRRVAPRDRARLLRRFAAVVDEHLEVLAQIEVSNAGHTIGNARWEAGNVRDVLDYYAGAPERLSGRQIPVPGGLDVTFHEPLGVVGVIVPWNFPVEITLNKLAIAYYRQLAEGAG